MRLLLASLPSCLVAASASGELLVNGGFEYPGFTTGVDYYNPVIAGTTAAFGWQTSEPTGVFEVWSGSGYNGNGPTAWEGNCFLELNYQSNQAVWQRFDAIAGTQINCTFAHRGRNGIDRMRLDVLEVTTGQSVYSQEVSDGMEQWGVYSGEVTLASAGTFEVRFTAIATAGPDPSFGNFLDGVSVTAVPAPPAIALLLLGTRRRRTR